jgi:hypothetical protein
MHVKDQLCSEGFEVFDVDNCVKSVSTSWIRPLEIGFVRRWQRRRILQRGIQHAGMERTGEGWRRPRSKEGKGIEREGLFLIEFLQQARVEKKLSQSNFCNNKISRQLRAAG